MLLRIEEVGPDIFCAKIFVLAFAILDLLPLAKQGFHCDAIFCCLLDPVSLLLILSSFSAIFTSVWYSHRSKQNHVAKCCTAGCFVAQKGLIQRRLAKPCLSTCAKSCRNTPRTRLAAIPAHGEALMMLANWGRWSHLSVSMFHKRQKTAIVPFQRRHLIRSHFVEEFISYNRSKPLWMRW